MRPADVAIRIGESPDSQLISRLLIRLEPKLYAAPDYIARFGAPASPQELSAHQCLPMLKTRRWELYRDKESEQVAISGRYTLNGAGMLRRLAALGQGIILLPEEIVAHELACGELVRILPEWRGAPLPVYALTETRLLPARTRVFIDFLRQKMAG